MIKLESIQEPKVSVLQAMPSQSRNESVGPGEEVQGFNTHWCNILLLEFFLMPVLALLPMFKKLELKPFVNIKCRFQWRIQAE